MAEEMPERTGHCACGSLAVTARGEPLHVYLCSCLDCQRGSGSAFSYAALFPEADVSLAGESRQYSHPGQSGRVIENSFCPACGSTVAFRAEGLPGTIGVPVGCFADPGFAAPTRLFWASRRHHWLDLPETIIQVETQ